MIIKTVKIRFLVSLLFCGITTMLFAQKEVKLTPEEVFSIHNSTEYIYGSGWHNVKEDAINIALDELKSKLENTDLLQSYKIAKLENDEGYYFMVYIEKNVPTPDNITETVLHDEPQINPNTAISTTEEKQKNEFEQNPIVPNPDVKENSEVAIATSNVEINDLYNTLQYEKFIKQFQIYNRQNKMWASSNAGEMTNINDCYVAIFKDNELEVFLDKLDKNTGSRKDFRKGNIIPDFETVYNSNNYKIIWIELIEQ